MTNALGFVGLGVMGEKMCRNLARKSGKKVYAFDQRPGRTDLLEADGVIAATSLADLAQKADVIFLSLPGQAEVRAVCTGPGGLLEHGRAGQTIVDTSTNTVRCVRDVARQLATRGIEFADAPVSRTREAAAEGTLSIMVGATPEVMARIKDFLHCMGSDVTHCGGVGTGEVLKIINNMLNIEGNLAVAEALTLGSRAGLDPKALLETVADSSGSSFVVKQHGLKFMVPRNFPKDAFSCHYALKDLSYALELGEDTGVRLDVALLTTAYLNQAVAAGLGDVYFPTIIKMVEEGQSHLDEVLDKVLGEGAGG